MSVWSGKYQNNIIKYNLYMDLVMTSMEVVLDSLEDTASQLQIHNKSSCRHNPAHQGSCVARIIQDQLTTEEQILFAVRQIVFVRFLHTVHSRKLCPPNITLVNVTTPRLLPNQDFPCNDSLQSQSKTLVSVRFFLSS